MLFEQISFYFNFSLDKSIYLLKNLYLFTKKMYKNIQMYIVTDKMYIVTEKMYIVTEKNIYCQDIWAVL